MKCPVCLSNNVEVIWQFNHIVPGSNFLYSEKNKALEITLGNIALTYCHNCGFLYNSSFSEELCDYNSGEYNNDQTESKYFNQYLDDLVDELSKKYKLNNKRIIEIGCGNGKFINKFMDCVCLGIDPALSKSYFSKDNSFILKKGYASTNDLYNKDFLLCRHTLEHIASPRDFIDEIFVNCKIPNLYFEIPRFGYLFENDAYNALTYEHCSWYSTKSIEIMFKDHGYSYNSVNKERFDTEYLSFELSKHRNSMLGQIDIQPKEVLLFCEKYSSYYRTLNQKIYEFFHLGKTVTVWGVAGKGVSLLTNINNSEHIPYAIDINPRKSGMYVPKCGVQIYTPNALLNSDQLLPDVVILTNRLYKNEIEKVVNNTFHTQVEYIFA